MTDYYNFFKDKKVLVTGGAGLIGSAFVERLIEYDAKVRTVKHNRIIPFGDKVEIIDGDLLQMEACLKACQNADIVIHAAGVSGGSKKVTVSAIPMYTDNLIMNTQMLEAARFTGVKNYLFVSNSSVYAKSDELLKEEDGFNGFPENETGMVKRAGETQCTLYSKFSNMKISIIRAGNAYGPYDNFDLESSHVVPALIRKAVERQDPYRVWGDGSPIRDFIHTKDIAEGGLFLVMNHEKTEPVNIVTGETVSIRELVDLILKTADNADAEVQFDSNAPPASAAKIIDISKMQEMGFKPKISLDKGLAQTIEWYRRNGGN